MQQHSEEYLSFIREIGSTEKFTIKLITAINDNGESYHAYLLMKDEHVPYLDAGLKTRIVNLEEYGVILAKGPGANPLPEVKAKVEAQFHDYRDW